MILFSSNKCLFSLEMLLQVLFGCHAPCVTTFIHMEAYYVDCCIIDNDRYVDNVSNFHTNECMSFVIYQISELFHFPIPPKLLNLNITANGEKRSC